MGIVASRFIDLYESEKSRANAKIMGFVVASPGAEATRLVAQTSALKALKNRISRST
jgi:hypothetical protein